MIRKSIVLFLAIALSFSFFSCSDTLEDILEAIITSLTSDFRVSPNAPTKAGGNDTNVGVFADTNNGYLVTWVHNYLIENTIYWENYACRISKTGEVLDPAGIYINDSYWSFYCPSTVFAGGNWIIATNQGGLVEWVGATRVTPAGQVLDTPPVNICPSTGMATILYPVIAFNGQEILCVTGIAGKGLYGTIFDSNLNILVEKFLIYEQTVCSSMPRLTANGNNFFLTFFNSDDGFIKLIQISPAGGILSVQDINEEFEIALQYWGIPTITTMNGTSCITYFETPYLWGRRYSSDASAMDSSPVMIVESDSFYSLVDELSTGFQGHGYTDLVWTGECYCFFWPRTPDPGISAVCFNSDLSPEEKKTYSLDSQCDWLCRYGQLYDRSYSLIRAAAIGNKVLTAWADKRAGDGRVYANLFEVTLK
ncbi:MAG: hypothetical protein JXB26_05025 [Candidatus Aminicenantes bacterium]|nr:hypothetical protein [Candidatus Aminicenantes bacterium]